MESLQPYSNAIPDLVSKKSIKHVTNLFEANDLESRYLTNSLYAFYKDYISGNILPLILLLLVAIFLLIRYLIKKNKVKENKKENKEKHSDELFESIVTNNSEDINTTDESEYDE